jgi:ABC-2 type transport system ATP-binding protein
LIRVDNIRKSYGHIVAVNNISFQVNKGDILGFIGPNGAGKTTTLRMLACFIAPDGGTARINDYDIREQSLKVRRSIGYFMERAPLYGEMTVQSFLHFICEVRGVARQDRKNEVIRVAGMCDLLEVFYQRIDTLSSGFQRRVCLAQTLVSDPPVLILDEPLIGLDPNQKMEIRELITRMSTDKSIIISTHMLDELEAICNRALMVLKGVIVSDSTPEDFRQRGHGKIDTFFKYATGE